MGKGNLVKRIARAFSPEKDTGEKRPVYATVAIRDSNDKFSEYPSNGLTPRRLARIFKEANEGEVRRQMELFEDMEEKDTHLFSQIQTRKLAVTGLDWKIQPFSKEEKDMQISEFVDQQMKRFDNLSDIFMDMLDAIGKGISISELEWGINAEGRNVINDIVWVHPKKLLWDSISDVMKICTRDYPAGIELPRNKFVLHQYKAKSGHPSRAGVLRIVSWMYLFKNYDIKDWVAFCEVFGMPLRLGKYDPSASEDDKRALMEAIVSLGSDAAGMISAATDIAFVESQKTTSVEIYEKLARYADEQMSKAILGQTLTSDSGGGSYAQGKVHGEVKHDLIVADATSLAATLRRDVVTPLVEYNFGPGCNIPFFLFECQEAEDLQETAQIYKTLSCDMGLQIPVSHIRKKFSIPEPKDNEEVLGSVLPSGPPTEEENVMELKAFKDGGEESRQRMEAMAEVLAAHTGKIFEEMFQPILKMIDDAGSLAELRESLKDGSKLQGLYRDMDTTELQDVIHQGMYLSDLLGRTEI